MSDNDRDVVAWLKTDPEDDANPETFRRLSQQIRFRKRTRVLPWAAAAAVMIIATSIVLTSRNPSTSRSRSPFDASVELQAILDTGNLDPATKQALQASIDRIDVAIKQAEAALAADTSNEYVVRHLARLRQAKLAALRDAAGVVRAKL
jgi:hypothetical protein